MEDTSDVMLAPESSALNENITRQTLSNVPSIVVTNGMTDYIDRVKNEDLVDKKGNLVPVVCFVDHVVVGLQFLAVFEV